MLLCSSLFVGLSGASLDKSLPVQVAVLHWLPGRQSTAVRILVLALVCAGSGSGDSGSLCAFLPAMLNVRLCEIK